MKKLLFAISIISILVSCGNKSGKFKHEPRDTVPVAGIYWDLKIKDVRSGTMRRVMFDTLKSVDIDSIRSEKQWIRDSAYLIVYMLEIDSATAKLNNLPPYDKDGKKTVAPFEILQDKRSVKSGWDNLLTAVDQLKKEAGVIDTTKKK